MRLLPRECPKPILTYCLLTSMTGSLLRPARKRFSLSVPHLRAMTTRKVSALDDIRQVSGTVFAQEQKELRAIQWAGIFGSYARNEQHEDSDIDFLLASKQVHPGMMYTRRDTLWIMHYLKQ